MYDFFQMTQGQQQQGGSFEMDGDALPPIPKDTQVLAACEEAKWDEYQGKEYISLKWRVAQPAQFNNRVFFQKLHVKDADMNKAQKAMQMLGAIDYNAGGKMVQSMRNRQESMPSGESLQGLTSAPMLIKLGVWELDDKSKSGNWVKAVAPYVRQQAPQPQQQFAPQQQVQQPNPFNPNGDIPF